MDESTLSELLECSVCLDRMDISARVLPCQHTFCRKCLQDILASRGELTCPECRTLVTTNIDDLPPNILLVRILEGMKNNVCGNSDEPCAGKTLSIEEHKANATRPARTQQECIQPHAYALCDFSAPKLNNLRLRKGDLVSLKFRIDENWYIGSLNGREGSFPANCIKVVIPLASPPPLGVARFDFKMSPIEEEGCLAFRKGAVFHVLRRVDENWAEGRIGTIIGIFPIAYADFNTAAKQLLSNCKLDNATSVKKQEAATTRLRLQQSTSNSIGVSSHKNVAHCNADKCSSHQTNSLNAGTDRCLSVQIRDKRKSLNALIQTDEVKELIGVGNIRRRSAEILSENYDQPVLPTRTQQAVVPLPWHYIASYSYKSKASDELDLIHGHIYLVTERGNDGWFKGKHRSSGVTGVFPGNYVAQLQPREHLQLLHKNNYEYNLETQPPDILSLTPTERNSNAPPPRIVCTGSTRPLNEMNDTARRIKTQTQFSNITLGAVSAIRPMGNVTYPTFGPKSLEDSKPLEILNQVDDIGHESRVSPPRSSRVHTIHTRSESCPSQLIEKSEMEIRYNAESQRRINLRENLPISRPTECNEESREMVRSQHILNKSAYNHLMLNSGLARITAPESRTESDQRARHVLLSNHSKSRSLDASSLRPCNPAEGGKLKSGVTESTIRISEMGCKLQPPSGNIPKPFRCIAPYLPNNKDELELRTGDTVYVHGIEKGGWYKGTHSSSNKTGLFPVFIVEPCNRIYSLG